MKTLVRIAVVVLAGALLAGNAFAGTVSAKEAEDRVRSTVDEVKRIVAAEKGKLSPKELDKKIEAILLPDFDFELMSRSCLGASWKKATPEQQTEFVSLFTSLLARSYLEKIRKNIEKATVTILPSQVKEDRVVVRSRVTSDGNDIQVDYRIYQKDGKYLVYDVMVENVGLVSNYRSEFASILDSGDFSSLLVKLRTQTAKALQ